MKKQVDPYGTLTPQSDDLWSLTSEITGLFLVEPIVSPLKNQPYCVQRAHAKVAQAFYGDDGEVHPTSIAAQRMAAIADGIAEAVVDRIGDSLAWTEQQRDDAAKLLCLKRDAGLCRNCLKNKTKPRLWLCEECWAKEVRRS